MSTKAINWISSKLGVEVTENSENQVSMVNHSAHGMAHQPPFPEVPQYAPYGVPAHPQSETLMVSGETSPPSERLFPDSLGENRPKDAKEVVKEITHRAQHTVSEVFSKASALVGGVAGGFRGGEVGPRNGGGSSNGAGVFGSAILDEVAGVNTEVDENGLPVSKNWYFFNQALGRWDVSPDAPMSVRNEFYQQLAEQAQQSTQESTSAPPPPPPPPTSSVGSSGAIRSQASLQNRQKYAVPTYFTSTPQMAPTSLPTSAPVLASPTPTMPTPTAVSTPMPATTAMPAATAMPTPMPAPTAMPATTAMPAATAVPTVTGMATASLPSAGGSLPTNSPVPSLNTAHAFPAASPQSLPQFPPPPIASHDRVAASGTFAVPSVASPSSALPTTTSVRCHPNPLLPSKKHQTKVGLSGSVPPPPPKPAATVAPILRVNSATSVPSVCSSASPLPTVTSPTAAAVVPTAAAVPEFAPSPMPPTTLPPPPRGRAEPTLGGDAAEGPPALVGRTDAFAFPTHSYVDAFAAASCGFLPQQRERPRRLASPVPTAAQGSFSASTLLLPHPAEPMPPPQPMNTSQEAGVGHRRALDQGFPPMPPDAPMGMSDDMKRVEPNLSSLPQVPRDPASPMEAESGKEATGTGSSLSGMNYQVPALVDGGSPLQGETSSLSHEAGLAMPLPHLLDGSNNGAPKPSRGASDTFSLPTPPSSEALAAPQAGVPAPSPRPFGNAVPPPMLNAPLKEAKESETKASKKAKRAPPPPSPPVFTPFLPPST